MRNWTYSYKTSDGLRHEGTLSAPSKDAAFEQLRRNGIRAIRVDESPSAAQRRLGGLTHREWAIVAAAAAIVLTVVAATAFSLGLRKDGKVAEPSLAPAAAGGHLGQGNETGAPQSNGSDAQNDGNRSTAYRRIAEEVDAIRETYRENMAKVDYELLANYALVERVKDLAEFQAMIAYGRGVVSNARDAVTRVFRANYANIPVSSSGDRGDAQRLYGLAMEELDAADESLDGDDCVLTLLDMNRGRWHVARGMVVWEDARLERQFRLLGRESGAGRTRWEWDASREEPKAIESNVVGLPPSGSWSVPAANGQSRKPKSR